MSLASAERRVGFHAAVPGYLPPGYVLDRGQVGLMRVGARDALWMEFLNGVDSFSLFQARGMGPAPSGLGRAKRWDAGGFSFFLMGELPHEEVQKVKKSTRP
jgi:hypothetical protein